MKKIWFFVVLFISFAVFAKDGVQIAPIGEANTIELQLQVEKWVNTTTALVTMSSDATLEKGNLTQTRGQILQKMNFLADKADWNITVFSIAQSDSGLEQLHVEAQARIAEDKLGSLRDKAKDASKPGLTIRVLSVDFSPSMTELEKAKAQLREQIYSDATNEMERINKAYPGQNYTLRSIVFQSALQPPSPMPLNVMAFGVAGGARAKSSDANGSENAILSVGTKMQMSATVQLATAGSTFGHPIVITDTSNTNR